MAAHNGGDTRKDIRVGLVIWLVLVTRSVAIGEQAAAPRPAQTPPVQVVGQKDGFFTTSDGVKIHYLPHGDSGSWVVLIHG